MLDPSWVGGSTAKISLLCLGNPVTVGIPIESSRGSWQKTSQFAVAFLAIQNYFLNLTKAATLMNLVFEIQK